MKSQQEIFEDLVGGVATDLRVEWTKLSQDAREDVSQVADDLSRVMRRAAKGEDVEQALAEIKLTINNWTWTGAAAVQRSLAEVAGRIAYKLGTIGAGVIGRMVGLA